MPVYAYDPRLVKVEDTYYIIWCGDFYGAAIGMAKTTDFKTFTRIENPFLPFNRNAVLFPRKINGNFMLLSRPSDSGHTPFGDIFVSESPDLTFWGKHRHVMGKGNEWWHSQHGRTTSCREPLTLFWTASGFECNVSGSEFWVEIESTYEIYEPWFSYTINGDWIGRQMLPRGRYWLPLFRGMSADKIKNVRFFKDLQAMSNDGASYIHIWITLNGTRDIVNVLAWYMWTTIRKREL